MCALSLFPSREQSIFTCTKDRVHTELCTQIVKLPRLGTVVSSLRIVRNRSSAVSRNSRQWAAAKQWRLQASVYSHLMHNPPKFDAGGSATGEAGT